MGGQWFSTLENTYFYCLIVSDRPRDLVARFPNLLALPTCLLGDGYLDRLRDALHLQTDEFSEKFQTGFDPPPHFRKIISQIFSEIHDRSIVYNGKNQQY